MWRQHGSHGAVRYQLSVAGSFAGKSGCAVKLFFSSARGIAVNLLHHKSDSSFLSTEIQLLSSFLLRCCVGTFGVPRSQAVIGKQRLQGDLKTPPCFTDLWAPFSLIHLYLIPHWEGSSLTTQPEQNTGSKLGKYFSLRTSSVWTLESSGCALLT